MNSDHIEPLVADGSESVWGSRPDDNDIAGADNNLLAVNDHDCLTREDDTSFGIRMLMESRAFA